MNELDPVINVYLKQLEARVGEIDERARNSVICYQMNKMRLKD